MDLWQWIRCFADKGGFFLITSTEHIVTFFLAGQVTFSPTQIFDIHRSQVLIDETKDEFIDFNKL